LASLLFVLFGLWLLFDTALDWRWVAVVASAATAVSAAAIATSRVVRASGAESETAE
jgi:Ca2+/H+ antiporter, TMEM165/GDT1 family